MKSAIFFTVCFYFFLTSFGQWNLTYSSTGPVDIIDIYFLDLNTGFVVGTNSIPGCNALVKRTIDGGNTWSTMVSITPTQNPSIMLFNDINSATSSV